MTDPPATPQAEALQEFLKQQLRWLSAGHPVDRFDFNATLGMSGKSILNIMIVWGKQP